MPKRRGGWPARTHKAGERVSISFRVTPEFKAKMDLAASKTGRSLAQEAERLIEMGMIFETLIALGQAEIVSAAVSDLSSPPQGIPRPQRAKE